MNKASCKGCFGSAVAILGVSTLALLAGVGYARAQVSIYTDPVPAIPAKCNGASPAPFNSVNCTALGGTWVPSVAAILSSNVYTGPAGVTGVTVTGNTTVDGKTTLNGDTTVNGNHTVNGNAVINGSITNNGGTNTTGGTNTDTLTVSNGSTLNGGATVNGGLDVHGGTTTDTLHVTGKSVFDDAVTVNTGGDKTVIKGGGATFTDASGSTTIKGNKVTTGTVTADKVFAGGHDVGNELADHNTRINNVQSQADITDGRLNNFNGTGGSIEHWGSNVDSTLNAYGDNLNALNGWREMATAQLGQLQKDTKNLRSAVAANAALPPLMLSGSEKFGLAANWGNSDGANAIGVGGAFSLGDGWQVGLRGAYGIDYGNQYSVSVGVAYKR